MILDWIELSNIRNIQQARLALLPSVNLIVGGNGDGKTSILEAIYCLSSGRSFRQATLDAVIRRDQEECLLRGSLLDTSNATLRHTVAVQRSRRGQRRIRVNGEDAKRSSELAALLPVLLLHPLTVDLLLGPPENRRRYLNWGLFHVKPGFQALWQSATRSLKQRNTVLRSHAQKELASWTEALVRKSNEIDAARQEYVSTIEKTFMKLVSENTAFSQVELRYQRGWQDSVDLAEIYRTNLQKDVEKGFTTRGFHRADVKISVDGENAPDVCSRGELKILSWLLMIAQGSQPEAKPIYLIDDPAAELDDLYLARIGALLAQHGNQIVATGTDEKRLRAMWPADKPTKVFHVKHGKIKE